MRPVQTVTTVLPITFLPPRATRRVCTTVHRRPADQDHDAAMALAPDFSHAWHRVTTESLASCVRAPRHSSLVGQGRIIFRPLVLEASQYQHDTVHVTPVRFHWIAAPHARGRSFSRLK